MSENRDKQYLAFAKNSVDYKQSSTNSKGKFHSTDKVIKALQDPIKNHKVLQEVSMYLSANSLTYRRLLNNFANMVNFDFMLTPKLQLLSKNSKNLTMKSYLESASIIEKINPKFNFKWMNRIIWELGEVYLYKIEDKKGIIYKRMPEQLCRISSVIENSLSLYSIDLSLLSNVELLSTMPSDIQELYEKFSNKQIPQEMLVEGKWYELTENAIAFNGIDSFLPKGYPILAPLFPSLLSLEESNRRVSTDEEIDNLKIVHMLYDVNEDGASVIDPEILTQFHQSVKDNLPEGCCVATNPLKLSVHNTKNSQQSVNYRKEIGDIVYSSVGSSKELFNGERNSNMAIDVSIKSDEVFALSQVSIFENYLNYELSKVKKTSFYGVKMLPTTHYNMNAYKKECETSLSLSGNGNYLKYLACCGYSPLDAMGLLQIEQELGLSEMFMPASNAYNTSTDDSVGRPSGEEKGEINEREGE